MTFEEAKRSAGKPVRYNGEEYVLLQIFPRKKEFIPGVEYPFALRMLRAFDAILFHPGRNAASFVPIEQLEAVPKKFFQRRLVFGEEPARTEESEEIELEV